MIDPDNVHFVLVKPSFLGNIGSVARVMKNFAFKNLRLVLPPRNYKDAEARKMSLGAFDLLKSAQCFDTLSEALKDINIAVGSTCAKQRVCRTQLITDVIANIRAGNNNDQVAIVLGEERDGLSTEDLSRCNFVASIPCNPEFPSLNLAQAAGIFAYELLRPGSSINTEAPPSRATQTSGTDADEFLEHLSKFLHHIEFTKSFNHEKVNTELRALFNRARPSDRELQLLKAILKKLDGSEN